MFYVLRPTWDVGLVADGKWECGWINYTSSVDYAGSPSDYNSSVSSLPRCRGLFGGLSFLEFDLRSKVVIGTMCKYASFNV